VAVNLRQSGRNPERVAFVSEMMGLYTWQVAKRLAMRKEIGLVVMELTGRRRGFGERASE
jgi:hypothetical protein